MKKILSGIIALSIVISMLPLSFAADTTVSPVEYKLTYATDDGEQIKLVKTAEGDYVKTAGREYIERTTSNGTRYLDAKYFTYAGREGGQWKILDVSNEIIDAAVSSSDGTRALQIQSPKNGAYLQMNLGASYGNVPLNVAFALKAPETAGFYIPAIVHETTTRTNNLYIGKYEGKESVSDYTGNDANKVKTEWDDGKKTFSSSKAIYSISADEIVLALTGDRGDYRFDSIILTPISDSTMTISIDEDTMTASVTVSGKTNADGAEKTITDMPVSNNFIKYSSDNSDVATIDPKTGLITPGEGYGIAKISAETADGVSCSVEYEIAEPVTEPEKPGEKVTDTTVSVVVQSENTEEGTVSWNGETVDEVNMGDTVSATATANEGYVFRYWKNAIGQVLSEKAEESFIINTNSAITAVFDKVDDTAATVSVELFNANGMPFDNKTVDKDTTFADAIKDVETPTYTGFGSFKHWSMYADESKIDDNMLIKQNTRAVAIFNEPTEKYTVKVNGTAEYSDVLYGTEVTVSSTASDFSYWKLGEEIVSYDKDFKFTVWGDVNLTEVKEGSVTAAPVATLTTVGSNPLLIYSVPEDYTIVEAGILFGSTNEITISSVDGGRAAAARGTGQFTAQPKAGTAPVYSRGYLIFKNASGEIRILYAN